MTYQELEVKVKLLEQRIKEMEEKLTELTNAKT